MNFQSPLFYVLSAIIAGFAAWNIFDGSAIYTVVSVVLSALLINFNFFKGGGPNATNSENIFSVLLLVGMFVAGAIVGMHALYVIGAAFIGVLVSAIIRLVVNGGR